VGGFIAFSFWKVSNLFILRILSLWMWSSNTLLYTSCVMPLVSQQAKQTKVWPMLLANRAELSFLVINIKEPYEFEWFDFEMAPYQTHANKFL
jgi:hypothetical protein